jgi:hypothetical protein
MDVILIFFFAFGVALMCCTGMGLRCDKAEAARIGRAEAARIAATARPDSANEMCELVVRVASGETAPPTVAEMRNGAWHTKLKDIVEEPAHTPPPPAYTDAPPPPAYDDSAKEKRDQHS